MSPAQRRVLMLVRKAPCGRREIYNGAPDCKRNDFANASRLVAAGFLCWPHADDRVQPFNGFEITAEGRKALASQ